MLGREQIASCPERCVTARGGGVGDKDQSRLGRKAQPGLLPVVIRNTSFITK